MTTPRRKNSGGDARVGGRVGGEESAGTVLVAGAANPGIAVAEAVGGIAGGSAG